MRQGTDTTGCSWDKEQTLQAVQETRNRHYRLFRRQGTDTTGCSGDKEQTLQAVQETRNRHYRLFRRQGTDTTGCSIAMYTTADLSRATNLMMFHRSHVDWTILATERAGKMIMNGEGYGIQRGSHTVYWINTVLAGETW
jgi:hypothetical protein